MWSHVAGTYDGSTLRVYVNGVEDGSLPATGPIPTNTIPLIFGADSGHGSLFDGAIDEVTLYGRALSAQEIAAWLTASAAPPNAA